jgi:hypothetical protein
MTKTTSSSKRISRAMGSGISSMEAGGGGVMAIL